MTQMKMATPDQQAEISAMCASGALDHDTARAIIEKRFVTLEDVVEVPDLPASELIKLAEKEIGISCLDSTFTKWDFIGRERGMRYEVLTHRFDRAVMHQEVRKYFREKDAEGSTAALVAWFIKRKPFGYHATAPDDLWRLPANGKLFAPCFYYGGSGVVNRRSLELHETEKVWRDGSYTNNVWEEYYTFVAFRLIP
jgi:hypothetical protein